MSPTMNTATTVNPSHYIGSPDTMDRHEFGVQKNRKQASTGGGRAWSEDEEVYLLQTRLQKMPYKHIAAHLKKTELACRLHYHQLSHGSNRRKRTASDASSNPPILSRDSTTPPSTSHGYSHPFSPEQVTIHLPPTSTLLPRSASSSPQRTLPAILPKPTPARTMTPAGTPPLRLDCALPPMNHAGTHSPVNGNIDLPRLASIYDVHRSSFWGAIASDYGNGVSAMQLEDAYFRYQNGNNSVRSASSSSTFAPPTPCISPDGRENPNYTRVPVMEKEKEVGKTSISALLGIDASPRSPRERELIRQMEEGRASS